MSVLTEAKIRKMFREAKIVEHGTFEVATDQKLTPAAKGFLTDHHVNIVSVSSPILSEKRAAEHRVCEVKTLEDSVVYSQLYRLMKLYPIFLTCQRELYFAFQAEKCDQVGSLLKVVEHIVEGRILEDISLYGDQFLTHTELQDIRISKQLNQQSVLIGYQEPVWKLVLYTAYTEVELLRRELEYLENGAKDCFLSQVCQLLKSIEVLLWLITSEES
ncbi:hypothetical protein ABID29_000289 [Streptococcus rupicaprae]|uniref:Ethanolamine utilization cobalamin adenosyltransferase n=1 Tax=Streptococcus rupicaprae TaxID=759619 RepID=A0ABV2FFH6_9STRE